MTQRELTQLDEETLLQRFGALVHQDRSNTATMLAHIAEIDERKLWAKHACQSMFAFCVERFHMSESLASKRIWAARTAQRFPVILEMLHRGDLHLSGVALLAKHLTEDNHEKTLERATHKTMRQIEVLIAEIAPRADVPSRIVTLPNRTQPEVTEKVAKNDAPVVRTWKKPAIITPLAPRRFKLQVTLSQESRDKFTELQELLSHQIPDGDPARIVDKALDALLDKARKRKAALTDKPRKSRQGDGETRTIAAAVRREVFKRDDGRCKYVDSEGNRCTARCFIEFHHMDPYALGGKPDVTNIELRCQAHNQYEADLDYGELFMNTMRHKGRRPDP